MTGDKLLPFHTFRTPIYNTPYSARFCAAAIYGSRGTVCQCSRAPKHEYGGHKWCAQHYPPNVKQREDERQAEAARIAAKRARRAAISAPMPVLQGWQPDDYLRCYDWMLPLGLPDLIGIGSVCRRHLHGPDGLVSVIGRLDAQLPPSVRFHLFGVKGFALDILRDHPRVSSVDSAAWDQAARRERKTGRTVDYRIEHMRRWYAANVQRLSTPQLHLGL